MIEEYIEKIIENSAIHQLRFFKTMFAKNNMTDKEATLCLAFYINKFVQHGYKGNKPSIVLDNIKEIIKQVGEDSSIPLNPTKSNKK